MNVTYFNRVPWRPLMLLWLAYAWLGWYLSEHHIVWLVGAFVLAIVLTLIWRSIVWLEGLIKIGSMSLFIVVIVSILIALIATWSLFTSFVVLPLATTLLAEIELRFAGFCKRNRLLLLTVVAAFGLTVGKVIDIVLLPASRYS
ncbi:hypothetical protein BZZ01_09110 [Nostocales cyanobacterium HT-58-2]|nr:hypothetical protein BZZ01_09110 [Nostocales cyanobacterium HT-58-2]